MFAHIVPHFHVTGVGFFLILFVLIAACALIFSSGSKENGK